MTRYISKAFVYHRPRDVRLEEQEIDCSPTDMVIKVVACARCGTDKVIFQRGHSKVDPHAPIVLGHELLGEVVEVGRGVGKLKNGIGYKEGEKLSEKYLKFRHGQRVTLQARIARYRNGLMLLDDPITIVSFYINGGYSQYLRIPKELILSGSVLRVPDNISDQEAVLIEPAACVLESIFSTPHPSKVDQEGRHLFRGGIERDGLTIVIGSGSVSMLYAYLCQIEGAKKVFMLVRSQIKASLVKKVLGDSVIPIVNAPCQIDSIQQKEETENNLIEELRNLTKGNLFNDVIVACSDPDAQRLMLRLFSPGGYAVGVCFGGAHKKVDNVDIDQHHYRSAKSIGTSGCSTRTMETILSWLEKGKISLKDFVCSRHYSLESDPKDFFTTMADGLKPVLYPWE